MLTIKPLHSVEQVAGYYYGDGHWDGLTATRMGFSPFEKVEQSDLRKMADGINPSNDESYLQRQNKNRIVCYDMQIAPPKSVSIMAVTMQDMRLEAAHKAAAKIAFDEIETLSNGRVRKGLPNSSDKTRATKNIVAAVFTHHTSRALDPQLHTHHAVFNVTYDAKENTYKALSPHQIFTLTNYITEIYRSELAKSVRDLGYEIEHCTIEGKTAWRLKAVPMHVEVLFSKRRLNIKKVVEDIQQKLGKPINNRAKAVVAVKTRVSKDHERAEDPSFYVPFQQSQLEKEDLKKLQEELEESIVRTSSGAPLRASRQQEARLAEECLTYVIESTFERQSVVKKQELVRRTIERSKHMLTKDIVEKALLDPKYIHRDGWVMTVEEKRREESIRAIINDSKHQTSFKPFKLNESGESHLSDAQALALRSILTSKSQFIFLSGKPGVGKTTLLNQLAKELTGEQPNEQGKKQTIIGLAPSSAATDELRKSARIHTAQTLSYFLNSGDLQAKAKGALIVLDEAGLASTKQMLPLLTIAVQKGARVLFVGDTGQHNSVETGDALRLIERHTKIETIALHEIIRQKTPSYKKLVELFSSQKLPQAWQQLEAMGAIVGIQGRARFEVLAKEYVAQAKANKQIGVIAPTWDEIEKVTHEIRLRMGRAGLIHRDKEQSLKVKYSLGYTKAQKGYVGDFTPGLALSFHKSSGHFKQGEIWHVVKCADNELTVELAGVKKQLKPNTLTHTFDVVDSKVKQFAPGDPIIIKANYATSRQNKLKNGMIERIESISSAGTIQLESGKLIGPEFRQFTHAYALTSLSEQSRSYDHVFACIDSRSGKAISKEQMNVTISRGKKSLKVFTDNKEKLREQIEKTSSRSLVYETIADEFRDSLMTPKRTAAKESVMKVKEYVERWVEKMRVSKAKGKDVAPGKDERDL